MLGDLTDEELAAFAARDAPAWAKAAVGIRQRLLDANEDREHGDALLAEVEDFSRTLRRAASGASPEVIARIGRVRGAISAHVLRLKRRMGP